MGRPTFSIADGSTFGRRVIDISVDALKENPDGLCLDNLGSKDENPTIVLIAKDLKDMESLLRHAKKSGLYDKK